MPTQNRFNSSRLALPVILLCGPAWAQYWPVQGLLNVASPSIRLLKGTEEIDRVKKEWVQRMSDVSERVEEGNCVTAAIRCFPSIDQ